MHWLLRLTLAAIGIACVANRDVVFWVVVLIPAWLVLVPLAFPPIERKVDKTITGIRAQRDLKQRLSKSKPSDSIAGLSLAEEESAGNLSLTPPGPLLPKKSD